MTTWGSTALHRMTRMYSCVLGDIVHAVDRAKVPTKHEHKKGYYVTPREICFEWDAAVLKELKL